MIGKFGPSPSRSARVAHRFRLAVENLEDRTLLSSSGLMDLSTFRVDPALGIDPNHILVRFRAQNQEAISRAILPGSQLGAVMELVPGLREVTLPAGVSVQQALAAYQASPFVEYAEPNSYGQVERIPNDPNWSSAGMYGLRSIQAPSAWDWWTGATWVVAADMDTGANYDHPDLCRNIWVNQGEIPYSRYVNLTDIDGDFAFTFWDLNDPINQGPDKITDQNADGRICGSDILAPMNGSVGGWADGQPGWDPSVRVDDLIGWDFNANTRTPTDTHGHGTHTAGTIGAVGNNGVGVVGVNWIAQIMVLKIGPGPGISISAAIAATDYAWRMGAVVSNNSWGGGGFNQSLFNAISAARAAGHIYVAAAGNNNRNNDVTPFYPANYGTQLDNVISVAASTSTDARASFSNWGFNSVHLAAPGNAILSTGLGSSYTTLSGTSMAAPHVTGAVLYLLSILPGSNYLDVKNAILNGVDLIPAWSSLVSSRGRLNLNTALYLLATGQPGGSSIGGFSPAFESEGTGTPGIQAAPAETDSAAALVEALTGESAAPVQVATQSVTTLAPVTDETRADGQAPALVAPATGDAVIEREETLRVERIDGAFSWDYLASL